MEIYNLTKQQVELLSANVSTERPIFVPELNPLASMDDRNISMQELQMLDDLVNLGILDNISEKYQEIVESHIERNGYGLRFYTASAIGKQMFDPKGLVVN